MYWYLRHLCSGTGGWGSIGQSRVIFQVLCSGIQVISALVLGGPLARIGLSVKFGVLVFKASLLWYLGDGVSIGQSRVICQLLSSGMQVISALAPGGSIGHIRFCLPSLVYWYLRYLCSGTGEGGHWPK